MRRLAPCFAALRAGTDLELNQDPGRCGGPLETGYTYADAPQAVREGLLNESFLDVSAGRTLELRARIGLFDPPTLVPYNALTNGTDTVLSTEHIALCRELAAESATLLRVRGWHFQGPPGAAVPTPPPLPRPPAE